MAVKTVSQLAQMLERGETTSLEIVTQYLTAIDKHKEVNAYITVTHDTALQQAKESDRRRKEGKPKSKYDGIPIAIKDNICTKGVLTTCASGILQNFIPPYNATAYQKLLDAGFILLGKTNLDEFAMGSTTETSFFGPTKNPVDTTKVPGGSSGGSAAAVAADIAPVALGSDTGGSIRQPASFCGVVGIKPTYGRVSRYGLVAFASSLDQIGTFAHTVKDAASVLAVIAGVDARDATSIDKPVDFGSETIAGNVKGLRIGVPQEYFNGVDAAIVTAVKDVVKKLESQGAVIREISLQYTDYAVPIYYLIATAEASSNLARYDGVRYGYRSKNIQKLKDLYVKTRQEGFGKEVKRRIILGTFALSSGYYDAYYLKALKGRRLIIDDFTKAFSQCDCIVAPVTTTTAFGIGEKISDPLSLYMADILTIQANLAGIPAMSVPVAKDAQGLPIGVQIMAKHFNEKVMCNVAQAIEDCVTL
ncbi:MAG: Asp-tRNA(Asn)/Glu-tRNA(Gln) amidotransferase subunit GatA [Spirochaetota bacterium]